MRIGELARRTDVSQRLLRYYEEQGLLRPQRLPSGYREYGDADVERVQRIRSLLAAGLSTTTIADVLPCTVDTGDGLAAACPGLVGDLRRERDRISSSITELRTARAMLDAIIGASPDSAEATTINATAPLPVPQVGPATPIRLPSGSVK